MREMFRGQLRRRLVSLKIHQMISNYFQPALETFAAYYGRFPAQFTIIISNDYL